MLVFAAPRVPNCNVARAACPVATLARWLACAHRAGVQLAAVMV
jgi:hypothetical protein